MKHKTHSSSKRIRNLTVPNVCLCPAKQQIALSFPLTSERPRNPPFGWLALIKKMDFFPVLSIHSLKVSLLCHSYLPFGFLCLRNVHCFFSMPVIFLRPGQTLAAFNATSCNIVGQNMLHTFAHHVVICCNILDDVVSNLKTARFFVQHFGY